MKNKKMYLLNNDLVFKTIFSEEKAMKRLLEETLGLKVDKIYSSNTELNVETIKEKKKILDLIVETDKGIINIEVNNDYHQGLKNRNFLYFCKLIGSSVNKNDSYINIINHIQLNLTWNLKKYIKNDISNIEKLTYEVMEKTLDFSLSDYFKIYMYNMDYYKNKCYNEGEKRFIKLLVAESIEEMERISKGDKLMEEITNKVKRLNLDEEFYKQMALPNDEEKLFRSALIEAEETASKNKEMEIAKKMLLKNSDIKFISEVTGLSEEEIKNLK